MTTTTTTTMGPIECEPFADAQEFSDLMPSLFKLYGCHGYATYPFSYMRQTLDLTFVCKDATAEKVVFSTPTGLENALQNSEMINSPDNNRTVISAPHDDSWAGWTLMAIHGLVTDVGLPRGQSLYEKSLYFVLLVFFPFVFNGLFNAGFTAPCLKCSVSACMLTPASVFLAIISTGTSRSTGL
jgi:hypothetical protein